MSFLSEIQNPPRAYSPAAFWFWYGDLKPDRLRWQIDEMVDKGVYNGFMHSRAYLKTPYLEEGWWEAVSACVEEGNRTGFYPWLYDEYAWPSGTAGSTFAYGFQKPSRVLAKGECNMAKSLAIRRYASAGDWAEAKGPRPLYVFRFAENGWTREEGEDAGVQGEILAFYRKVHPRSVDYLNRDTIRLFMDYTHEAYKARYGAHFGSRIPGIFFDEIYMQAQAFPWTDSLPDAFQKRRGYDLIPLLPALAIAGGEKERQIRRDYYQTIAELYEEAFFVQISEWCGQNHLKLTGHTEEHLPGHPGRQGNFFSTVRHLHIPGADNHDYRYRFPRKITFCEPKYAVSVARAYGRERAMSEAMGGAGWGCSLQQFKRGINTMGAMGISMFTLHGFYSECDKQGSQSDWPTSFFFQNPYWRYFKHFAAYISRVCYMNASGLPVVDVGLYYPIEEMQAETVAGKTTPAGEALSCSFHTVLNTLLEHQIDADMIDPDRILAAEVSEGRLCVGAQRFRILLCPDCMDPSAGHRQELMEKLRAFEEAGGILIRYAASAGSGAAPDAIPAEIPARMQPDVQLLRGSRSNLFVNHRKIDGKDCYWISNSSPLPRFASLLLRERGSVQKLSPEDGQLRPLPFHIRPDGVEIDLPLEADEACWLVVDSADVQQKAPPAPETAEELAVAGKWRFLPLPRELTGPGQLEQQHTRLKIPVAFFSSSLHPAARRIRIRNHEGEPGCCGRHLSLWSASWITRRPAWQDDSTKSDLFFRRSIFLKNRPVSGRICAAAVNEWTLWVNGTRAAHSANGLEPSEAEISGLLREGENLLAVQVHNDTPMPDANLCSAEELPPERMTSLLLQAEIQDGAELLTLTTDCTWSVSDRPSDGWETPSFRPEVHHVEASACRSFGDGGSSGVWLDAWERGCPPLLPWGDLPLFGRKVPYPQQLIYNVTLPAGTAQVLYPAVTGDGIRVTVDGFEPVWQNGRCTLRPDGETHRLEIRAAARSGQDGLHGPVETEAVPFRTALSDWRLHGLEWYSGFARYENTLQVQKKPGRYLLDLGQTAFQAEVWVNGICAGARIWAPYRLDITGLLRDGENHIAVIVSNSEAVERQFMLVDEGMALGWNRYWNDDNIQREGENLVSGLLGPVQILHQIQES